MNEKAGPRASVEGQDSSSPRANLCVYGGSFDPVTIGHLDVITRASALFERTIVAVGVHPTRQPMFTVEERLALLREATHSMQGVEISSFDGLLVHYCKRIGARIIVRGLRAASDFEYELQIAHANSDLEPAIDTIFLPTRTNYGFISASLVREIATNGGDVSNYAPPLVREAIAKKLGRK